MRVIRDRAIWLLILAVSIALSGCATTKPVDQPAIWRVDAASGHRMWLLGSIHRLPGQLLPDRIHTGSRLTKQRMISARLESTIAPVSWFHGPLKRAFRRSNDLMFETVEAMDQLALARLAAGREQQSHATCPSLAKHIDPVRRRQFEQALDWPLANDRVWPASGGSMLFALANLGDSDMRRGQVHGVDSALVQLARRHGKTTHSLETIRERLGAMEQAMTGLSCDRQLEVLAKMVRMNGTVGAGENSELHSAVARWRRGDIQSLDRQLAGFRQNAPVLYEALISARNRTWFPRLVDQLARRRHTLVVVGTAHLAGPENLIQMFESKGFKVERIQ